MTCIIDLKKKRKKKEKKPLTIYISAQVILNKVLATILSLIPTKKTFNQL